MTSQNKLSKISRRHHWGRGSSFLKKYDKAQTFGYVQLEDEKTNQKRKRIYDMSKKKTRSQIFDLLIKTCQKNSEYLVYADKVAKEAQKYISWSDDVTCESYLGEGLYIIIDTESCPADIFFDLAFNGVEIDRDIFLQYSR